MTTAPTANTCYKHPNRESTLRCNRCDKYICTSCAVHVPTGYRCKDCIREQKKVYDTALIQDYVLAVVIAGVLAYIGGNISQVLGFFTLFLAPSAGIIIAEVSRKVVSKRRSKTLFQLVTGAVVLGGLASVSNLILYLFISTDPRIMLSLLWPGIFIVIAAGTTYSRLSGFTVR